MEELDNVFGVAEVFNMCAKWGEKVIFNILHFSFLLYRLCVVYIELFNCIT